MGANAFTGSDKEFEFIIVGSGAGGGPLAVNLAKAGFQVLLIEAGGDELPMSAQIPAYHTIASEDPKYLGISTFATMTKTICMANGIQAKAFFTQDHPWLVDVPQAMQWFASILIQKIGIVFLS